VCCRGEFSMKGACLLVAVVVNAVVGCSKKSDKQVDDLSSIAIDVRDKKSQRQMLTDESRTKRSRVIEQWLTRNKGSGETRARW
jgi:hypothetical protein